MKINKNMSRPRLAIDENEFKTVCSSFFKVVQDLTILKILSNLKALNTVRAFEPALRNSRRPTITIIESKTLNPSLT